MMAPDRSLRVCIPIGMYPPLFTGQGIQLQRTLPHLRARGVEATILTRRLPRAFGPPPSDVGTVERVLAPGPNHLSALRRAAQFRRYFARRRGAFDVLHSDTLGWEFLLNVRHLKSQGLPVILEMALLGGDDPISTSKERFGSLKLRLLRQVDIWLGVSGAFLPRLLAAGIPGEKFRLVYPGVDVDAYRPLTPDERRATRLRLGLPTEARVVISVGGVMRRKGTDRLLRAWEHLRPRPGHDLLLVVGPASAADGLQDEDLPFARGIRETSAASGLDRTVSWVGRVENVNDYLGAADLFLFLSRQEGLGIVILEALSCGLPCVVSPLDGIAAEIVLPGRTGVILNEPDDAGAVSACVSSLLDRPEARAAMGETARKTIEGRFSFDTQADALASLYRELVGRARFPGAPRGPRLT